VNHSEARALLGDYLEGDLEVAERRRLDEHLPECASCSEELRELRSAISLLRGLPDPEPPSEMRDVIMARIGAGEATAPVLLSAFRRFTEPPVIAALAAGVAALAVFVGLQAVSPERGMPPVGPLAELPFQAAPDVTTVGPASFRGAGSDELEQMVQAFFRDRQPPDSVLEHLARQQEAQRSNNIRVFVNRVQQRHDSDALRRRFVASKHPMAPVLVRRISPVSQRHPSVIPASSEVRGR
jgi:hypothetical protein